MKTVFMKVRKESGFTIIEVCACLAVILILASLLLTAIVSAREKSKQAICINNERQLGFAVMLFALDEECYPEQLAQLDNKYLDPPLLNNFWASNQTAFALTSAGGYYGNNPKLLMCPNQKDASKASYGYNKFLQGTGMRHTKDSSIVVVLADSNIETISKSSEAEKRHNRGLNAFFVDGHTLYVKEIFPFPIDPKDIPYILPPPQLDENGFTTEVVNIVDNDDDTTTITITVTSDGTEETPALSFIIYGLPDAAWDMALETAISGQVYDTEIVDPDPITGISGLKFELSLGEDGIVQTEFFEFSIPSSVFDDGNFVLTIDTGTKAGQNVSITEHTITQQ
ncbi:type II secretion system protein [Chlamydiota bacterium]